MQSNRSEVESASEFVEPTHGLLVVERDWISCGCGHRDSLVVHEVSVEGVVLRLSPFVCRVGEAIGVVISFETSPNIPIKVLL